MTHEQSRAIIETIRRAAADILSGGEPSPAPACLDDLPYGGLFVTFRNRGRLRGCMGTLSPQGRFTDALLNVIRSSLRDPRFRQVPITADELADVEIEASILSPVRLLDDPSELEAGRHGVVVSAQGRSGCFLPQVALENGWDSEEFLTQCCTMKAGLPGDAWRDPGTRIEVFEADIVTENRGDTGPRRIESED